MTHYFGTDRMGSDVYSRILFGARITIAIAVIAIGVSVLARGGHAFLLHSLRGATKRSVHRGRRLAMRSGLLWATDDPNA